MNLKKKFSLGSKKILRILALMGVLQTGCASLQPFQKDPDSMTVQLQSPSLIKNLTPKEKIFWKKFIKNYSQKSMAARKILSELFHQNAKIQFFVQKPDKNNVFLAGKSDENTLGLNRLIESKRVSLADTFFHEAEHVAHLKRAHQNGINAASFASLDDVYIYATLLEALAYRKAALCCAEYNGVKNPKRLADSIFIERLKNDKKDIYERLSYEQSAFTIANLETNSLPKQVYFKNNPDWDKIVSILSRDEVKKVPVFPQPTILFLGSCLASELEKHPNANTLSELDLSCALVHKSALQKNEVDIKRSISNFLIKIDDICCHSGHSLSREMRKKFFYYIGCPDLEQERKIAQKKTNFMDVRDLNLKKFKTSELFDAAIDLIRSPQIQAYQNPKISLYARILAFEKMILVPNKNYPKIKTKQSTR